MAAPGSPFFAVQIPFAGSQHIVDDPGILEHLMMNNTSAGTMLWAQVFDNAGIPPDGTVPNFVFPLPPLTNLFWTPPQAAAGGMAVIGWRFALGLAVAISSTPDVLTANATAIAQLWAWGRGTE